MNGRFKVSGTVTRTPAGDQPAARASSSTTPPPAKPAATAAAAAVPPAAAPPAASSHVSSTPAAAGEGWTFNGSLGMENVRVNQLKLFKQLAGSLSFSQGGISVHGRGPRADEALDLQLTLPLLQQLSSAAAPAPASSAPESDAGETAAAAAALPSADAGLPTADGDAAAPDNATTAAPSQASNDAAGVAVAAAPAPPAAPPIAVTPPPSGNGAQQQPANGLTLRCGQLLVAADVDAMGSHVGCKVQNVHLDELELASLRGDLQVCAHK